MIIYGRDKYYGIFSGVNYADLVAERTAKVTAKTVAKATAKATASSTAKKIARELEKILAEKGQKNKITELIKKLKQE